MCTRTPWSPACGGSTPPEGPQGGPHLRHDDPRPARPVRLDGRRGGHPRRHGVDGVYWKPIFNILEGRFRVLLVNAQHIKQVPGRKTDVKDCEWIAQLLQHGLLRGSFIPDRPLRDLRDLTRQRVQLLAERTAVVNRIQKVLEDANIKLASVASDILGASGRAMLQALIGGEADPDRLAELAQRRLRGKIPQLRVALHGAVTEHHGSCSAC
jgi:transposase